MNKANALRRAIRQLLLAAPAIPLIIGCGPIERDDTFPLPDGGVITNCEDVCKEILQLGPNDRLKSCSFETTDAGTPGVHCEWTQPSLGRVPPGLVAARGRARGRSVGHFFAGAARLEAASVFAFGILAGELEAHRAPMHLVRAARRSARDEARHAAAMARLARRYGAVAACARVRPPAVRGLEAIAAENAAEGCVRETYGALVAGWQARTSADPCVKRELARIAADELRHAELSWRVAEWIEPKLTQAARRRVRRARAVAVAELLDSVRRAPPSERVSIVGLPSATQARHCVRTLARTLWT